jgi:hypothetical protein
VGAGWGCSLGGDFSLQNRFTRFIPQRFLDDPESARNAAPAAPRSSAASSLHEKDRCYPIMTVPSFQLLVRHCAVEASETHRNGGCSAAASAFRSSFIVPMVSINRLVLALPCLARTPGRLASNLSWPWRRRRPTPCNPAGSDGLPVLVSSLPLRKVCGTHPSLTLFCELSPHDTVAPR